MDEASFKMPLYLPAQGASETEATIIEWCVGEGDRFEKGQVLAQVDSAKSVFDFEAPCAGLVVHVDHLEGDVISLTDMKLLRLSREDYDRLCESGNPVAFKLAINSLEQLADRLRRTDQWITDLVTEEDHQPTVSEWTSFRELIFRGQ